MPRGTESNGARLDSDPAGTYSCVTDMIPHAADMISYVAATILYISYFAALITTTRR